jgi:serine/threonine protein kinase
VEGTPFGRYRLVELIGRGGMGEVWRAYDSAIDRIVAIKVLPAHLSDDEMFQQRFRREAHAAARLNDPHVIPIHFYGEIDGRLYVDMRLIEGRDLQAVLADGPLEAARAVRIIEQVATALHAAHEVGLVHRDVKPSNILLDKNDFAYLIDFGIARALDETRLTSTGNAIGTFHYMAPERLGDHPTDDARADIYALACVLYECLTGQPPFAGASMGSLVAAHLQTPPPQPSATQPNVPKQVDQVIATGMAKDPDNRYATTVELADAARDAITVPTRIPDTAATALDSTQTATGPTLLDEQPPPAPGPTLLDPGSITPAPASAAQQQPADLNLAATQHRPPGWPPVPQRCGGGHRRQRLRHRRGNNRVLKLAAGSAR